MNAKELMLKIKDEKGTLTNNDVYNLYNTLDYKEKLRFTKFWQDSMNSHSFNSAGVELHDRCKSYGEEIFTFDEFAFYDKPSFYHYDDEKLKYLDEVDFTQLSSLPFDSEAYSGWTYHGGIKKVKDNITRRFPIKIGIPVESIEHAQKVYEAILPYLINNEENICFKIPTDLEEHLKRDVGGNLFTIYTTSNEQAAQILKDLEKILEENNVSTDKNLINTGYIAVGNTGLLSVICDFKPYTIDYIPRQTDGIHVGRDLREDTYLFAKKFLEKNNLLFGKSITLNDENEKKLKFGKYKNLRPRITKEEIKKITSERDGDIIAYILGKYNIEKEDLSVVFNKENDLHDAHAYYTLRSFGYNFPECIKFLHNMNESTLLHSFEKYESPIIPDMLENKEFFIDFLKILAENNKPLFDKLISKAIYELDDYLDDHDIDDKNFIIEFLTDVKNADILKHTLSSKIFKYLDKYHPEENKKIIENGVYESSVFAKDEQIK